MVDGVVDKVLLRKFCGGFILWVESESWAGLGRLGSLDFMNFLVLFIDMLSKVSFFLQCSKMQIIPKKFYIKTCFFQFLRFFILKC